MVDDKSSVEKITTRIPRSKDSAFNIRDLSMREFEAFMILLNHDGIEQSILKSLIDLEFGHTSPTKGYDYINNLCNKVTKKEKTTVDGKQVIRTYVRPIFAYKKKTIIEGKQVIRIYVKPIIRKNYEKFILPTISSVSESLNAIIKDYVNGIKEEEKIREKFKVYTETIILSIKNLITNTPVKTLSSQRFQRKMNETIMRYYRAEILKYEVFSK
jgi:hypothetical protein